MPLFNIKFSNSFTVRQYKANQTFAHKAKILCMQCFSQANSGNVLKKESKATSGRRPKAGFKRFLDITLCLLAMPVVLPVGFLLALFICFNSPGKPIYRQERIGKDGKPFMLYKFRTMVNGADKLLDEYLRDNPEMAREWQESQKLRNDPRLTSAGKFLRKTSLDELPQIINIFQGNMTLVGPRPIVADEKERYGRYFQEYCEVYPGLTGLWQTSGRNNTTYVQRVAYDHYYINNWTIWLDMWILAKTIPVTIRGYGAY